MAGALLRRLFLVRRRQCGHRHRDPRHVKGVHDSDRDGAVRLEYGVDALPLRPAMRPPVPAGLEKYYNRRLDWGSCADLATSDDTKVCFGSASLQCAELTVPLSYADPTGPTITLKVLRKRATDQAGRIGSVVSNPGGPGGSGVENAAYLGGFGLASGLNKQFDLIGFDPRGVGFSSPEIRCPDRRGA